MDASLRQTYDRIADDFLADHSNDRWSNLRVSMFADYLPAGARVLDVGCGPGLKSRVLTERGLVVHGLDFSERMVELAGRTCPDGTFETGDVLSLELDGTYDAVLAFAVLLHVPRAQAQDATARLVRAARPDGYVMIAVKESRPGQPLERDVIEDDYGYSYCRFFSYFDMNDLRGYLSAAGARIVSEEHFPVGDGKNWLIVIARRDRPGETRVR